MTLYILNYNNYYNRLVKKEASLEDYQPYVIYELLNTNFNSNDCVSTQHIIGTGEYSGKGDYVLVIDEYSEIVSRWFIIEAKRTRAGQWLLDLKRDVVVDYYNIIANSPMYIEKGYVGNDNPLVYNSENVTFNQIKKGEYLIKNTLDTPWLVAYLSRFNGEGAYNTFSGSFKLEPSEADEEYDSLEEYPFYKYDKNNPYRYTDAITFAIKHKSTAFDSMTTASYFGINKAGYYRSVLTDHGTYPISNVRKPEYPSEAQRLQAFEECYSRYLTFGTVDDAGLPINSFTNVGTFDGFKTISDEAGKVIKVGNDNYLVVVHSSDSLYSTNNMFYAQNNPGTFGEYIYNKLVNSNTATWTIPTGADKTAIIQIPYNIPGVYVTLQKMDAGTINYSFNYTHNVTRQAPYEIIAAPLKDLELTYSTLVGGQPTTITVQHSGEIALQWFLNLGQKHTAGLVYDVQIVPYCPIDTTDWTDKSIAGCYLSTDVNSKLALAVKLEEASFSKVYSTPANLPIDLDYKTSVNCDLYRLCSPNGVGDFDFSIAKNNGINGFEIDCTLIPYNPYIKVNPVFDTNGLYGGDYNDYRGLICKGDFSLPITTDQWETYELQNKNYQAIFDRETATLEIQNKWARTEAWTNIGVGTLAGAAGGALAGSMVQPGIGTAIGAVGGAVMSATGGIIDAIKLNEMQEEMMSARHDQFQLNLQTIRARPNTLTRTTAYNINNKYFPYIEYYTCTDVEKEAFRYKMKYDGMTISAIGNIEDYIHPSETTFVKGRLIRLEGIDEDYHVAQELVNELNRGVYI